MRVRTTLLLLLAVLVMGGFIWFFERGTESTAQRQARAARVVPIDRDRVTRLAIAAADLQVECVRERDAWVLAEPPLARADAGAIDRILSGLEALERGETVTAEDRQAHGLGLADYGLEPPRTRITAADAARSVTLLVGRDAPVGQGVYVMTEGSGEIVSVDRKLLDVIPESVVDLRDRAVFQGEPGHVRRIAVQRADGYVQAARTESGDWIIQQPLVGRADRIKMIDTLNELFGLRIQEFVADRVQDAAEYGLDEPELRITLWTGPDDAGETLLLGRAVEGEPEQVYALWQGLGSVYAIPGRAAQMFRGDVSDFRDRRLVPLAPFEIASVRATSGERVLEFRKEDDGSWLLVEPRQIKADRERIEGLVDALTSLRIASFVDFPTTNLAEVGLEPPALALTLSRDPEPAAAAGAQPGPGTRTVRLRLGSKPAAAGFVFAQVEGETALYTVAGDAVAEVPLDPLAFRDREVIGLEPDQVRRLALLRQGTEQVVERENGLADFRPVPENGRQTDPQELQSRLDLVCRLTAARFVEEDPGSLGPFGLDTPRAELRLGLSGEAGIEKDVLFGAETPAGQVYAMIRGQDVVFLLDRSVQERLTGDLFTASPPAGEEAGETATPKP